MPLFHVTSCLFVIVIITTAKQCSTYSKYKLRGHSVTARQHRHMAARCTSQICTKSLPPVAIIIAVSVVDSRLIHRHKLRWNCSDSYRRHLPPTLMHLSDSECPTVSDAICRIADASNMNTNLPCRLQPRLGPTEFIFLWLQWWCLGPVM